MSEDDGTLRAELLRKMDKLAVAVEQLKVVAKQELGLEVQKILVDKTLPLKYELTTGKKYGSEEACDPFTSLQAAGVVIVGRDNERLRNHPEWPETEREENRN